MSTPLIELRDVRKKFPFFSLEAISMELAPGQIMGLVGPNGAGKSTTIRILMGLLQQDSGDVRVLGHAMPSAQALAKRDIGFVSDDMHLVRNATLDWHMQFIASLYPNWDANYAAELLSRFNLKPAQTVRSLSHGEHVKALLLLSLARRPRLLVLDEPTSGLDPVARHEVLSEFMDILQDEERAILFSSHNTVDVERISDRITFIDRGRIIDSSDKEVFLERWRRLNLRIADQFILPNLPNVVDVTGTGRLITVTTNDYSPDLHDIFARAGGAVHEVQRMTLEEIFVANVMRSRKERVR